MKYPPEWTAMIQGGETVALISTYELALMFQNAMTDRCIRLGLPYTSLKPGVHLLISDQAEDRPGEAPTPTPGPDPDPTNGLDVAVNRTIEAFSRSNTVVRTFWNTGTDSTGCQAIYFRIVLTDEAAKLNLNDATSNITRTVYDKLRPIEDWGLTPYFSFRSESEMAHISDQKWSTCQTLAPAQAPDQAGYLDHNLLTIVIAERDAWRMDAGEMLDNRNYYRGLVTQIGNLFGIESRTQDDGGIVEDVLCDKVPELVSRKIQSLESKLSQALSERDMAQDMAQAALEESREYIRGKAGLVNNLHMALNKEREARRDLVNRLRALGTVARAAWDGLHLPDDGEVQDDPDKSS